MDDKWSKRFSRLEALLLSKSFAVPVKPVRPSTVVTRKYPFFDLGASSSVVSSGLVTEGTGLSLVQTTGIAVQLSATQPSLEVPITKAVQDVSKSATHPVQGPGTSDVATQLLQAPGAETASKPLQAPGAGTATQPLQAPGAGPTSNDPVQLDQSLSSGRTVEIASESESEPELDRDQLVPTPRVNCLKILLTRTSLKKPTTERQSEGSDPSWAGIRCLISTVLLLPWMVIHLLNSTC